MAFNNNIPSPCIHVCTHDTEDICLGCMRSLEEIRHWYTYTDEEKQAVLDRAMQRRKEKDKNQQYDHYV